jgi:hypothetical protein
MLIPTDASIAFGQPINAYMRHVVRQMVFVAAVAYLAGCAHDVTSSIFEINKVAGTGESKPAPGPNPSANPPSSEKEKSS